MTSLTQRRLTVSYSPPSGDLHDAVVRRVTEVEEALKEAAVVSMGTDISEQDLTSIQALAEEVKSLM